MIGGQFLSDPKYAVYTYSAFKRDNNWLLVIFTIHEVCFMWQAWTGYLSIVTISSLNAVELTYILDGMSRAMKAMKANFPLRMEDMKETKIIPRANRVWDMDLGSLLTMKQQKIPRKTRQVVEYRSSYNIETLLSDYERLMLASDLLNGWCSYRIVGVHCIGYIQFITEFVLSFFCTFFLLKPYLLNGKCFLLAFSWWFVS